MEQRLLEPLTAFETSLNNLVTSLTTTNTFGAAPKAARELVIADEDLTEALVLLKRHQDNFQEILRMRTEKEDLKNKLKNTVYECVRLKKELKDIDSRIVDESDTEDEDNAANQNPIAYETLLAFASRIGKHNVNAVQEAEKESDRIHEEARKQKEEQRPPSQQITNGVNGSIPSTQATTERPTTSLSMHTQEAQARVREFRNLSQWERSQKTAPFPDATFLRLGVLGQLQMMREDAGDDAVQAHIEKLVRTSELKSAEEPVTEKATSDGILQRQSPVARRNEPSKADPPAQRPQQAPAKPKLNLDLPDSDSDSDDD